MTDKYYARFYVKHQDASDSYLRKAYTNLDLHTDGTYVKEKTDWLIMTKMEEQGVSGGESVILHLDDWEHLDELSKNPVGQQDFIWGSPKVKMLNIKLNILFLKKIKMENQLFLTLINFQNLKIWNKVYFYKDFQTV
jgi:protein CsiD